MVRAVFGKRRKTLRNSLRYFLQPRGIDLPDLPEKFSQPAPRTEAQGVQLGARVTLEQLENEHIARVIQEAATMEEAAHILGIDPATLYRKRKKLAQ